MLSSDVALNADVITTIFSFLNPADIVASTPTCRTFADASAQEALWAALLRHAAKDAARTGARALRAARKRDEADAAAWGRQADAAWGRNAQPAANAANADAHVVELAVLRQCLAALGPVTRRTFWSLVRRIAIVVARELAAESHAAFVIMSLDFRLYDVSQFANEHPGGEMNIRKFRGRDASRAFDVFGHTAYAHSLMRQRYLLFDAHDFCGRPGLPTLAILPRHAERRERLFATGNGLFAAKCHLFACSLRDVSARWRALASRKRGAGWLVRLALVSLAAWAIHGAA
ncbi:hypothetical protein M885DRAFT_570028 [Pelagophyceae sp. CCMP2097]|nr:hypothetical protein M885DRAFT_570028 [Pelagophyceae sp. CCMP2097]